MKRSVGVVEVELVGVSVSGFGNGFIRGCDDEFVTKCIDGFIDCDGGFVNWVVDFINCVDGFINSIVEFLNNPIDKFVIAKSFRTYTNIYALVTRSSK